MCSDLLYSIQSPLLGCTLSLLTFSQLVLSTVPPLSCMDLIMAIFWSFEPWSYRFLKNSFESGFCSFFSSAPSWSISWYFFCLKSLIQDSAFSKNGKCCDTERSSSAFVRFRLSDSACTVPNNSNLYSLLCSFTKSMFCD